MSTLPYKRKRARKACIPCHQRKRKCDAEFPCNMCTTYEYDCRYIDNSVSSTPVGTAHASPLARRGYLNGESDAPGRATTKLRHATSRAHRASGRSEAESLSKTATAMNNVPAGAATPTSSLDEHQSKSGGTSATMAFPHILGLALGSDNPPKVHSFAYNFGIRPEEASVAHDLLGQLISEEDLDFYSNTCFSAVAFVGDLIDPRICAQRCRDYYGGSGSTAIAFGAVAAGIAAIGSFLSSKRHPRESDLVQYAKAILDDPASVRLPQIDHIIAWGMRVFYLRATSHPNNAWIASCTTMHLCESLGLHEEEKIKKMASVAGAAALGNDVDRLRRIFWISWAAHNLQSYEYDRSAVRFRAVTCQAMIPISGSIANQFVQLVQIIPTPDSPFALECQSLNPREELFERLKELEKVHPIEPFLVMTKADLAFCFYRRIYQLNTGLSDEIIQIVIDSGNAAVKAAENLARHGRLFWNVIGSVFHYACVLLAMDTPTAFANIATAFKGLENLVKTADTKLTREALSIAQHLLSLNMAKKRKELAQLESLQTSCQSSQAEPESESEPTAGLPDTNWELDWELDWDQFFLEPYPSIFNGDV